MEISTRQSDKRKLLRREIQIDLHREVTKKEIISFNDLIISFHF